VSNVVDLQQYKRQKDAHPNDVLSIDDLEWQIESIAQQGFEQLDQMATEDYRTNPAYFSGEMFRQLMGKVSSEVKRSNGGAIWLLNYMHAITDEYLDKYDCRENLKTGRGMDLQDDYFWHRQPDND
jgi:hypothetical protein